MDNTKRFDTNDYVFNENSKNGIYIIHGFTSTTYEVKDLAKYLSNYDYYVKAKNLPGHGTSIDDCNNTKYTEWLSHVEKDVADMASDCDEIHVVGISMGGVLALHLASLFPLSSVTAAATVFKFKNEFNARVLTPLLNWLIPTINKSSLYKDGGKLKFHGYSSYPMKALNQMRKLTNVVRPNLKKINCPILLIHTKLDLTCIIDNLEIIKNEISSIKIKELILEESTHNLFVKGPEQDIIFKNIQNFIKEKEKI